MGLEYGILKNYYKILFISDVELDKNFMLRLPHPERTIVHIDKLIDYCLNTEHPSGKHKARVFKSALNLGIEDAEILKTALLDAVHRDVAVPTKRNAYGQKYIVDFEMSHSGRTAEVRSIWIVRDSENFSRFVTCYISTKRGPDETT